MERPKPTPTFSRRGLIKGALAAGGLAAGGRLLGPVGDALAAEDRPHFVHIFLNGGFNALFAGNADKFLTGNVFGVTSSNIKNVGNGVFTDAETLGTLPQFALDHWAAVGIHHKEARHTLAITTRSGGERAILMDGADSYLNKLAHAMGGDSALKSVYFGDRQVAYQPQKAYEAEDDKGKMLKVSLERISDLKDAIKALGAEPPDPNAPARTDAALSLETSDALSKRMAKRNPTRLVALDDSYKAVVEALRKPPPPPVTFADIAAAYDIGASTEVSSFASMMAGAEIMIRAANSNVVHVCDLGYAAWDFHGATNGRSDDGLYSRRKWKGEGAFKGSRIAPLRTFVSRMLNAPGRNVVICISGELARLPDGSHADGTVAVLLGKHVKRGVSYGVDSRARFVPGTPGVPAFWAAVADALKIPGRPFGANPHAIIA